MHSSNGALQALISGRWKRQREIDEEEEDTMNALITRIRQQGRHNHQRSKSPRSKKRKYPSTSAKMFVMDAESGEPRLGTPKDCVWWLNH
eukprot:scaffold1965_cov214-Chaetoceros_neogracile.AAC.1